MNRSLQNTVMKHPTFFPEAVSLIHEAREKYEFPSENWIYASGVNWGNPRGDYWGEVWTDGMDWNRNFWLIEKRDYLEPSVIPVLYFQTLIEMDSIREFYLNEILTAIMVFRDSGDKHNRYEENVWRVLQIVDTFTTKNGLVKVAYGHNSQEEVVFYINPDCMPPYVKTWTRPEATKK